MRHILSAIMLMSMVPAAAAAAWPNLLGEWKGVSRTVVSGAGGHFGDAKVEKPGFREIELTINWTEQDEGRLIGSISSANHTETKIGVISADETTFVTADHDGQSIGRILDADRFELCYTQTSIADPQMVASCVIFERQE